MINIKSITLLLVLLCFFYTSNSISQNVNAYDENNKRTGVWRKYYDNNSIRYEGEFLNGKEIGVFKFYDKLNNRFPTIIKEFSKSSDSVLVSFFSSKGKLQSKGYFINKKRVGTWQYFFENGKILSKENYKNGVLHGELINYYPNGKETEITEYKNGLKNGISKKFSSDGVLIEFVNYIINKLHGKAKYFDLEGNLKEQGEYKKGKRIGKWQYYVDGELATKKEKEKTIKNKKDEN